MPATDFKVWVEQSDHHDELFRHAIEQGWAPGPKNVQWSASVVCEPPQFVGSQGMFVTYRDWIKAHGFVAQYDHSVAVWYFEREDEAILFTFAFG